MRRITGAAVAAAVLSGCIATETDVGSKYGGLFGVSSDGLALTNAAAAASCAAVPQKSDDASAHKGPWSWEELAVRAGLRSDEARLAMLVAAGDRLKAARALAWKEPELRFGYDWANAGGSRNEFYKDPGKGMDPLDSGNSNGRDNGVSVGVRFYVPNPFVNRYLRARADAADSAAGAKAAVEAYAVYSEVKMLCYEAVRVTRELAVIDRQSQLCDELRMISEESLRSGVFKSPLDSIRAETKAMRLRINADRLRTEQAALFARIAYLADVPENGLKIIATIPSFPDAESLSADLLTEIAFARRPDLAAAVAELKSAEADVGAAKSANIPWFRFVEASYQHGNGWEDSYGKHTADHEDGFELKASVYMPVFTWMGDSVSLSKSVRDLADARLQALRISIRREVATALADYRSASKLVATGQTREFVARMERRIEEFASTGRARPEDTCKARDELQDYKKAEAFAEMMKVEAALRLESVIGGPVPSAALEQEGSK